MQENTKWDKRFLDLAHHISQWSKDPSTKVGAIIVDEDKRIVGLGYNGFPMGVSDDPGLYANRAIKYERVIHGEINAILNANKSVKGCTLIEVPFFSCARCTAQIIQSGIRRIVYPFHSPDSEMFEKQLRWKESIDIAQAMCKEAGIECQGYLWDGFEEAFANE
jgi:dCMP deaminase